MITLGIDVGTTHTKVLALDAAASEVLALKTGPTPVARDADGEAHQPTEILATVLELASAICAGFSFPPTPSRTSLLMQVILPLHRPAGRLDATTTPGQVPAAPKLAAELRFEQVLLACRKH